MHEFHAALNAALRRRGGWVDAFYHCPFHRDAALPEYRHADHPDRKPNPGMILRAMAEQEVDPECSFLIGDRESDIAAAAAAGIAGLRFEGGNLESLVAKALADPPRPARQASVLPPSPDHPPRQAERR